MQSQLRLISSKHSKEVVDGAREFISNAFLKENEMDLAELVESALAFKVNPLVGKIAK